MRAHGDAITTDPIRQRAWQDGLDAANALDLEDRVCDYRRNARARVLWSTFVSSYYRAVTLLRPLDPTLVGCEKAALALIDARPPRVALRASAAEIAHLAELLQRARASGIPDTAIRRYARPRRSAGTFAVKQQSSVLTYPT